MHLEANIDLSAIERLVDRATPLRVNLSDDGERWVELSGPRETSITKRGLRLVCDGAFRWTALDVPLSFQIRELRATAAVDIADGTHLTLQLELEAIDLSNVPALVERQLMKKVNAAMAPERTGLRWAIRDALSFTRAVPERVATLDIFFLDAGPPTLHFDEECVRLRVPMTPRLTRSELEDSAKVAD